MTIDKNTTDQASEVKPSEQDQYNIWRPRFLLLPRIAMSVGQWGIGQRLLMPGHYEMRRSRSFNRNIFRKARP